MERAKFRILAAFLAIAMLVGRLPAADGDNDEALRVKALKLNEVTGEAVMLGHLRNMLKDEAGTKKLIAVAQKMVKEKEDVFNYNAAYILARAAQLQKMIEPAEAFYKSCVESAFKLQSTAKVIQVYDSLIDLYFNNNKFEDAIKACQDFIDIRDEKPDSQINQIKPFIMERMIQSLAKSGKFEDAKKLNEKLIDADEGGWYFLQLRAWLLREEGKNDESAEGYLEVLEKLKKSRTLPQAQRDRIGNRIRYMLSGIYVDMKKIEKGAEQLQILLKGDPDNATYHNDLGFIWADNGMNLDESEKLIRKALELDRKDRKKDTDITPEEDKDNPAYLDSLGWVLFKKKDYKEARKQLELAVAEKEGQHIEIMDHLADVLMAMGEKAEAIKVWKKSLELEVDTKRDKERKVEVEKKLKKAQEAK